MTNDMSRIAVAQRIHDQLVYACDDTTCRGPACYTHMLRNSTTPARRPTSQSALSTAFALSNQPDFSWYVCTGNVKASTSKALQKDCKIDPSSLEQALFTKLLTPYERASTSRPQRETCRKPPRVPITERQLVDPVDAATPWYSLYKKGERAPPLPLSCRTSSDYQTTFFRTICFLRMQDAVASPELLLNFIDGTRPLLNFHKVINDYIQYQHIERSLPIEVRRDSLDLDAFNRLWKVNENELLRPIRLRLREPQEEQGTLGGPQDVGGVAQEFFHLIASQAFDPDYGLFRALNEEGLVWFNPWSLEPIYKFEMLGALMALAVHNGFNLPINLPLLVYWKLRDPDARPEDAPIEDGWPDYYRTFRRLLEDHTGTLAESMSLQYVFQLPPGIAPEEARAEAIDISIDQSTLSPSLRWTSRTAVTYSHAFPPDRAPLVSSKDMRAYIWSWLHWLVDRTVGPQFSAFRVGFHSVIPPNILSSITAEALKAMVEGEQYINTHELEKNTTYEVCTASNRIVRQFWTVVHDLDMEHRRRLLLFVSGSSRLPTGGAAKLGLVIAARRAEEREEGQDADTTEDLRLPSASTCVRRLTLPKWSSVEVTRERLRTALREGLGFGLV